MKDHYYTIQPDVFLLYPGYIRGVVIARDIQNGSSPKELVDLLRREEESIRNRLRIDTLTNDPCIASWREAYRKFGAKPGEYRSSIEAMARRILRGDSLPSINQLVDIGNIVSLRYLIPVGGHAIDYLQEDLSLRVAAGKEEFLPPGLDKPENPEKGEIIFTDGNIVLTRRWTWRQGSHTLTQLNTGAIEYNLDGLPPITSIQIKKACFDLVGLLEKYCHGYIRVEILSETHPRISLSM